MSEQRKCRSIPMRWPFQLLIYLFKKKRVTPIKMIYTDFALANSSTSV